MAKLTYKDLKKMGVVLTKEEAMLLHPRISEIAQHGDTLNDLFPKKQHLGDTPQANNVQKSSGIEPK